MMPLLVAASLLLPDTARAWTAGGSYGFEAFTRDRSAWHATSLQVSRRLAHGTLIGELLSARRFDLTDRGVAVEAYRTLWPRSYGNLRVQVVPGGNVLPKLDVAAEAFQAVSGGVEFSAGYRRMQYAHDRADLFSAGVAKYTGNWYLRARGTLVPKAGATGVSGSLTVRRYLATPDDFLDVQGGLGEELLTVGSGPSGPDVQVRKSRFAAVRLQKLLTPSVRVSLGATYNSTDGFPDRRGLTIGVSHRW